VPSLGVNFSGAELRDPHLADKIAWDLDRFDLAPARLTAEILESVLVESGDDTIPRSIAALARLGCRIDLDDFGTGNASMAALRRFSVGRIKIDRSFVTGIDENPEQRRLVAALLGFAERLGLDTLAEGVERVAEHSALAQLGCGHVQGYGIARPMPFKETLSWMSRYTERLAEGMAPGRRAI
jgi:EAL domain-containing protein (putative c-di-GMP-specific phosphodiesterase class I)